MNKKLLIPAVVQAISFYLLIFMFYEMDTQHWTWLPTTMIVAVVWVGSLREAIHEYINTYL